ncbi:MAG: 50S ribosomal protein L10 [Clostridia bacterium]|nr:50S ribosomal protein L10 [Clostridia bacterium]
MASEKILNAKKEAVAALIERLKNSAAGVIVDYKGTTVEDDTALRREMREAGVEYTVVKNTLLRFAVRETGLEEVENVLEGTTAIATSTEDVIAPAKILCTFAEKHDNFKVKAGFVEGKVVSLDEVQALAKTPSKETLLTQLVFTLNAPIKNLAVVLNQIAEKQEA